MAGAPEGERKPIGAPRAPIPPEAEEDNRQIIGFKWERGGVSTPRTHIYL